MDDVKLQIEQGAVEEKSERLILADSLATEEDMRRAIQTIAGLLQKALDDIALLKAKK